MKDEDKRILIIVPLAIGALFYQPMAILIGAGIIAIPFIIRYFTPR